MNKEDIKYIILIFIIVCIAIAGGVGIAFKIANKITTHGDKRCYICKTTETPNEETIVSTSCKNGNTQIDIFTDVDGNVDVVVNGE